MLLAARLCFCSRCRSCSARSTRARAGVLFKYSALAAGTFFVTVNLFGGVLFGMKTAQGALGSATNPGLAIASGTFDTLDKNAEEYIVDGQGAVRARR